MIRQCRVRSLSRYLAGLRTGESFTFGVRMAAEHQTRLSAIGFPDSWTDGEVLLPPADMGPSCLKNAEGWEIVHRDQPKETAYREFEWTWTEYHGPYQQENSRTVYQPYQRYPRTDVVPPSIEISTTTTPQGRMMVLTRSFRKDAAEDSEAATLGLNLLLEIFGEAELLREDLEALLPNKLQRLHWEVLPRGEHPWATLEPKVRDVLEKQGVRKRPVFEHRWSTISAYGPATTAVGRAGFSGYLIFGFPERSLFILESAYYGNATYVLDRDWEYLSSLTKAELLDGKLHSDRIIHREDWAPRIQSLLGGATANKLAVPRHRAVGKATAAKRRA